MNVDYRRKYPNYDAYNDPGLYRNYYSPTGLRHRLTNSSVLLAILLLGLAILYQIKGEYVYRLLSTGKMRLRSLSGGALGAKPAGDSAQPAGLGNMNNSCYQNSILQGLSSLKSLPSYLSAIPPDPDGNRFSVRTVDALRDFLDELNDPSNNGRTLWTPWTLKSMNSWQQQDAQEYYSKILDGIDKDISKAAKRIRRSPSCEADARNDDTAVSQHSDDSGYQSMLISKPGRDALLSRNPLEGLIAQRVACVSCGFCEGLSTIPFNCLTLNLGMGSTQHDLGERLDNYTKVEEINGVECPKCSLLKAHSTIKQILAIKPDGYPELRERLTAIDEALEEDAFDEAALTRCKIPPKKRVTSTKTKQAVIARPPRSLAVHMNRSVFDERTGHMYKNFAPVQFPKRLDLGPWCLGSAGAGKVAADGGESPLHHEEQWLVHPRASMVSGSLRPSKIRGPIYELRAVVTHFGAHESGHYICYKRTMSCPRPAEENVEETPPQLASEGDEGPVEEAVGCEGASEKAADKEEEAADNEEEKPAETEEEQPAETDTAPELDETTEPTTTEEPKPQWWRISDEDVYAVDEAVVLDQTKGVFMLFYDCVDPNSTLASEADSDSEVSDETIFTPDSSVADIRAQQHPVAIVGSMEEALTPDSSVVDAGAQQQPVMVSGGMEEAMLGGIDGATPGKLEESMLKLAVRDDASWVAAKLPLPQYDSW